MLLIITSLGINESKRNRKESIKLQSYYVSVKTGTEGNSKYKQDVDTDKQYWCSHGYYAVLDQIINHLELRFSNDSLELAFAIDNFLKLDMAKSMIFIDHYQVSSF